QYPLRVDAGKCLRLANSQACFTAQPVVPRPCSNAALKTASSAPSGAPRISWRQAESPNTDPIQALPSAGRAPSVSFKGVQDVEPISADNGLRRRSSIQRGQVRAPGKSVPSALPALPATPARVVTTPAGVTLRMM